MNLFSHCVTLQSVRAHVAAASRKRIFEEAANVFEAAYGIAHDKVFEALFARERLGSTCIGSGAALPHGRLDGIDRPLLAFLRTAEPVTLDAPDGRGVQLFFCILVPQEDAEGGYLPLLREVASLLSEAAPRRALLEAAEEIELCQILHDWEPPADLHPAG